MAVSGRKVPDFQSSISKGSAEQFDHKCDPCLTTGQHVEANGFCVDCSEYLCKFCYSSHQKTRASRHHQLLDKDNMGNQITTSKIFEVYTEKCSFHRSEAIKFFCPKHKALGCHDCITMDHRTCKIDYIPNICAGIDDSEEYKGTMQLLNQKLKEINAVMKKATVTDKEIDTFHDNLVKEITKFRKEINDRLDKLQKEIESEADRKKSEDKRTVQEVLQACTDVSADINKLQCSISTSNKSKQNGQLYISIKQAQSILKSNEVEKAEEDLEKTNMQYIFERNEDLENVISDQNMFGKLRCTFIAMPRKKTFDNITHKEDIDVRTKSDSYIFGSCITGCTFLASNKLLLADNQNDKLKIVDIQRKAVIEEKKLSSDTFDIAVMPHDQIAVTSSRQKKIIIINTASNLSTVRNIGVKGYCYGITYHQDHLYVVCHCPNNVLVLDTQGIVQYTLNLSDDMFRSPEYIVVSKGSRHIYISDSDSDSVVRITLQGDVSAVYKHEDLSSPMDMLMLDDGSLLVCCWNGTIHHISGDLQQGQKLIDNGQSQFCIYYSHQHDEVYVGGCKGKLKCYSFK